MKTQIHYSVLLVSSILFTSCGETKQVSTQETTAAAKTWTAETSWDFFLIGGNGTLTEDTNSKVWTITFTNVQSDMLVYSDRPEREAQRVTVAEFIDQWDETFQDDTGKEDSPNAALSGNASSGEVLPPVAFVLTKPVYDEANKKLTFTATLVNREIRPKFNTFDNASLAIDSTRWWNVLFACGKDVATLVRSVGSCAATEVATDGIGTPKCILALVKGSVAADKCVCEICKWRDYKTCISLACSI